MPAVVIPVSTPLPQGEARQEFIRKGLLAAYTAALEPSMTLARLVARRYPPQARRLADLGRAVDRGTGKAYEEAINELVQLVFMLADQLRSDGVFPAAAREGGTCGLQATLLGLAAAAGEADDGDSRRNRSGATVIVVAPLSCS
jgi:hypothetical protein